MGLWPQQVGREDWKVFTQPHYPCAELLGSAGARGSLRQSRAGGPLGGGTGSSVLWTQVSTSPEHTPGKTDEHGSLVRDCPISREYRCSVTAKLVP